MINGMPTNATGYRLRRVFGHWWLKLFNDADKNVGDYGPLVWSEVAGEIAKLKELGLKDIERELGERGK